MIVLVMGVTGSGKTTVGKLLAQKLGWPFLDADAFHPAENIEKMKHGVPLTDQDREPWLAAIHAALLQSAAKSQDAVLACSALKQSYRERLASGVDLRICYLKGTYSEIAARLQNRTGHFAGETILAGQFVTSKSRLTRWTCPSATRQKKSSGTCCGNCSSADV
jgi:gluconokinase